MTDTTLPASVFVTGGAGFIGSHVVDFLVANGVRVTVFDNLSSGRREHLEGHIDRGTITFVEENMLALDALTEAMAGHELVWHLGANTDIPSGVSNRRMDLDDCVVATANVLESMHRNGIRDILFASSGTVYGELDQPVMRESSGPLLPISLYGAGKLACEAYISGYSNLFGVRGRIFRFGNVIGGRMGHGVIHDFIAKLRANPKELEILGDGTQEKNYFLVEDCIGGMLYAYRHAELSEDRPCDVFNLGASTSTKVTTIAQIVIEEMGLQGVEIRIAGGRRGWPGDQPRVSMNFEKVAGIGWQASRTSDEAVREAVRRMLATPEGVS